LIIGDRSFEFEDKYKFRYDLGEIWTDHTGLPFVYATWVSNKPLPDEFITQFNHAVGGVGDSIDKVINNTDNEVLSDSGLLNYLTHNIKYNLNDNALKGLKRFLSKLRIPVEH